MAFNGTEASQVTLTEASDWTKNFRNTITSGETLGHFFGKDIINAILNQSECMGIRIYYGMEEDGTKNLVMVGAMANENDMETGVLAEHAIKCPHICGIANSLNS